MSSAPRKRVRGYYRKDGTYVRGHYRSRPSADSGGPARSGDSSSGAGLGEVLGVFAGGLVVVLFGLFVLAHFGMM